MNHWGFTIDNYVDVLKAGNGQLDLAGSFVNSLAILIFMAQLPHLLGQAHARHERGASGAPWRSQR